MPSAFQSFFFGAVFPLHPLHELQLPLHPAQPTGFPSLWFL